MTNLLDRELTLRIDFKFWSRQEEQFPRNLVNRQRYGRYKVERRLDSKRILLRRLAAAAYVVAGGGYNYDLTAIWSPFDCKTTALRPFDDYATTWLPHCGL